MDANARIYQDVLNERARQVQLKAEGRFKYVPTDPEVTPERHITWITEELGEAATEVNDVTTLLEKGYILKSGNPYGALRDELIQVIALTWGWIEKLDNQSHALATLQPPPLRPILEGLAHMEAK